MTMLQDPDAIAAAYAGTRRRATDLLRAAGPDVADRVVPACPQWTVAQLLAHMCGVCDDVLAGNLAAAGTDPWTDAQVAAFAGTPMLDIVDHWDEVGPQVEALIAAIPPKPTSQMVFDATTHEHDLRGALGRPGGRDTDAIVVGLGFLMVSLQKLIEANDLDRLAVSFGDESWTLGDGEAHVRVSGTPFELFRAFGGRRTLDEVRALDWSADPSPFVDCFFGGVLRPPTVSLGE